MISFKKMKEKIKEMGYYATDELLYDTYNALLIFEEASINPGQDIFAMCLEGPPGAGKTEFTSIYTKLANDLFGNVELVEYQCDAQTGKTELVEDINISAAIKRDADNVNISGKLVEAIKEVNKGKKIVLFIDEYDKAREETDAFFLQFLQSGKLNSNQHGDLAVEDKYKGNLQVFLCKNDMREELSGPLGRRIRITRLDYMEPSLFYKVANRVLVEESDDPVNDGLLNLVSLMYEKAYNEKLKYNRLPACSEMLIAIQDADRLVKHADAPQNVIYKIIIKNMFKSKEDIDIFESDSGSTKTQEEKKISALIKEMKDNKNDSAQRININSLIAEKVFVDENKQLVQKTQEMQKLIGEYKIKFEQMENLLKQTIEQAEQEKIALNSGTLVSTPKIPNIINNFEDESAYIKRGFNILELSNSDWTDVGSIIIPALSHHLLVDKLIEYASQLGIKIYENGILLKNNDEYNLIVINDLDKNNTPRYRIMSNYPVIPCSFISDIVAFFSFAYDVYDYQIKTLPPKTPIVAAIGNYSLNSLIYSNEEMAHEEIKHNVYHFALNGKLDKEKAVLQSLANLPLPTSKSSDIEEALKASKEIMSQQRKVLK